MLPCMSRSRPRLDPKEVKDAIAAAQPAAPPPAFHSPFAAAAADLQKLVPQTKKPKLADRLRERATKPKTEPTALGRARAENKAARESLAAMVKPLHRAKRGDDGT